MNITIKECMPLVGSYIQFCFLSLRKRSLYFTPKSLAEGIENYHGVVISEEAVNVCLLHNEHFPIRHEDDYLPVYSAYYQQFLLKKYRGNWHKFTFENCFTLQALQAWKALDIIPALESIKLI